MSAVIAMVVALAQTPPIFVGARPIDWEGTAEASLLIVAAMLLICGVMAYVHWRLEHWPSSAVLAAGLVAVAVNIGAVALGRLWLPPEAGMAPWLLLTQTGVVCLLATAGRFGRHPRAALDPCLAGFGLGTAAALVSATVFALAPPVVPSVSGRVLLVAGLLVAYTLVCLSILDELALPRWVRARVCFAAAILGIAQAIVHLPHSPASVVALIGLHALGTTVLCTTLLAMLFGSMRDQRDALADLEDRVERVEAGALAQRATLHEIRGTMGGIATASRLVHDDRVPSERRDSLQSMVESELERLARLMEDRSNAQTELIALDEVLRPLVVRQQAQGRAIAWQPSGEHCWGRADDIAEIINILLENSRRHAPGATTTLEVIDRDGAGVTIRVSDTGDGVPRALQAQIFAWGARRPGSSGQGLGLPLARRLAVSLGGSLVLEDAASGGASFRTDLPAVEESQDGQSRDAGRQEGGESHHVGAVVGQA